MYMAPQNIPRAINVLTLGSYIVIIIIRAIVLMVAVLLAFLGLGIWDDTLIDARLA